MERERDLSNQKPEEEKLKSFKAEIYKGLDINGAAFLKLPKEVEEKFINDFAKILIATSSHLRKQLPEVDLIHGWNEPLDGYSENHEIREILANATVDENYPNGIIRVSPFYLKSEFTRRISFGSIDNDLGTILPLNFLLPHEDFHVWQFLNQKDRVVKDCKVFAKEGLAAWSKTRTEIDANEFANIWIKNHRT